MPKKIFFRDLRLSQLALLGPAFCLALFLGASGAQTVCANDLPMEEAMKQRVQSAENIINDIQNLDSRMKAFHWQAKEIIAQSKKLQGEAEILQTKTPILPGFAKLTPSQYQSAIKQYQGDLHDFAAHAGAYDQHLKNFQATVGECHANERALNDVIKKYEIHVDQFHINNITSTLRPPHICGRLQERVGDMSHEANSMLMDQKRVLEAQLELTKTEATLQNAEGEAAGSHVKAVNEAKREEGEQALAAEFARLKDEYELLKVEKDRIAGNNASLGKVSHASVSAKLKKN